MIKPTFLTILIILIASCITINAAIVYKIVSTNNSIEHEKIQIYVLKSELNK
jgi:hypothetical protein